MIATGISRAWERMPAVYSALGVLTSLLCIGLLVEAFYYDKDVIGAAAQSAAGIAAGIALLVAIWAVIVTKQVATEIRSLSEQQRRLSAHTEVNRLWQQLNVDVFKDQLRAADSQAHKNNRKKVDPEILSLTHIVLGILRQIWIYQSYNEVDAEFWCTPAIYWSYRIRTVYEPEWQQILEQHRGYDIMFLEQVVRWSHEGQPDPSRFADLRAGRAPSAGNR